MTKTVASKVSFLTLDFVVGQFFGFISHEAVFLSIFLDAHGITIE